MSSRVHEEVRDRLDIAFDDGGIQTLKNIARPVHVWRWQPGTAVAPKPTSAPTAFPLPDKPSIVRIRTARLILTRTLLEDVSAGASSNHRLRTACGFGG